nr:MAG TPA: hypothetical protein [Caudoviricetes sp.]
MLLIQSDLIVDMLWIQVLFLEVIFKMWYFCIGL